MSNLTTNNATKIKIAAAILAGGKAQRLQGIAKGNLEIKPHFSIIQHLLDEIEQAGIAKTIIVANDSVAYLSYGVEIIADHQAGLGPLGGIVSALHYYRQKCEAILLLPCDMPLITAHEIAILRDAYLSSKVPIVYACTGKHFLHPLCAIVSCSVDNDLDCMLAKDIRRVSVAWKEVGAKPIFFENEIAFTNVNSMVDLQKWRYNASPYNKLTRYKFMVTKKKTKPASRGAKITEVEKIKKMSKMAQKIMRNAYVPYSNYHVGACVEAEDGSLFVGCNVENISSGLTLCAECTAISGLIVAGKKRIKSLLVVSNEDNLCTPCGRCRQLIREFASLDTPIYLCDTSGKLRETMTIEQLLPKSFSPQRFKKMA